MDQETVTNWNNKAGNPAQLGGIETATLDNGSGRGTRIAWINTGTGLRYKVVLDRAMDIADAFYNQHSLAWLSQVGITPPAPFSDSGINWLRTFGGGLLTTCGLSHVGGPETDEFGTRGLHGLISNSTTELESIIQPDPQRGRLSMSITGRIREVCVFGPVLELRRTISGTLGEPYLHIHDEVINRGNTNAPHMLLYHLNFGYPLVDERALIVWNGSWKSRDGNPDNPIFHEGGTFKTCPAPLEAHAGTGEEAAFIDPTADETGHCQCGIYNPMLELAVAVQSNKNELPSLTNWQHWGKGEYVTGLEPATHPPIGQAKARELGTLIELTPGESRSYNLRIEVLHQPQSISSFLNQSSLTNN